MNQIRIGIAVLLCAAMLFAFIGCGKQNEPAIDADAAVLTVGDVPVYATVYRHHLEERLAAIEKNNLYDRETYLAYIVNPSVYYPYPYRDTRTAEGIDGLCKDVLKSLALESASIYAARQAGYTLSIEDRYYIDQSEQDAMDALDELKTDYASVEAFYAKSGFSEQSFVRMYTQSREASIDFDKLLNAYRASHTLSEQEIEDGYARIVKETFSERYTDGMYAQYLAYYIAGMRSYPSLYVPDDAIFVRLFVHTDPTDAEIESFSALAETDFNALYMSADNEYTAQGTAGDLAVAPKDSMVDGLYEAAKDVPVGSIGCFTRESDGKTLYYLFLRVDGETGPVPIDRYPGVRERIERQIYGAQCMESLQKIVDDPSVTTRDDALLDAIRPEPTAANK